ncbi:MAG: hypothetical protein ACP5L5_11070, partial [Vulcanisaeta sp.]
MGLSNWWYYTGSATKAITIIGIIAITLLAIIIASPHIKPLQPITKSLGLIQTQTVIVTKTMNQTVIRYVNQTVVKYINQTVPIYVNRTVYVYMPGNASFGIPIYNNTGTCHLYSLVLPNGTIWTLGYWIPTQWAWDLFLQNGTIIGWEKFPAPQYGEELYWETTVSAVFPGLGNAWLLAIQFITAIPNTPQPNWVDMIYMGDFMGGGPLMYREDSYWGINNGTAVLLNTWSLFSTFYGPNVNYTTIVLPVNRTYPVILQFYSVTHYPSFALPCNWTIIGPVNPQIALRLPAPMGKELQMEAWYTFYGNYSYPIAWTTWGFWVWNTS